MARLFSPAEAKYICKENQRTLEKLSEISKVKATNRRTVVEAGDNIVRRGIMDILQGVPVEELSRAKPGLRVKALRDEGFETMADIVATPRDSLAYVYGISEDSAYTIKKIANAYVNQAKNQVKIKLSADDRSKEATALIKALYIYRDMQPISKDAKILYTTSKDSIDEAITNIQPALGSIKWLFTGKEAKERAEKAYYTLVDMQDISFLAKAKSIIDKSDIIYRVENNEVWKDFEANSIEYFTILEEICPGLVGSDDVLYGLPEELAREIQDECFFPDGLKCTLRNYQTWGVKYILHQGNVLLGDEMGLGKTVQAIAAMVSLKNTGASHFVVVCPASVITNWCREIVKHSKLSVTRIHGQGRSRALHTWIRYGGVAVTTYETTGYFNLDELEAYSLLVVDEAHYIKNPEAKRSKNVWAMAQKAERKLFMTGTALENKVDEMITLINMLRPDIASSVSNIAFMSTAPQFREKIAPVYYRRKREDVLAELPELIESKEWCTLTPQEELIYEESVLNKEYANVRRVSWNVDDLKDSSKAKRLQEIIEEAEAENRKVLIFSFFLDTIRKISDFLGDRCVNPINGSVPPNRRQEIIDEFDKAPAGTVLLAQIQSGGTGLNIQSASVVVICEPQYKPSIENQAISRAYRMGQARNVLVYRLLCENTMDEKIAELLESKQAIFDAFADKSVAAERTAQEAMKEPEMDDTTFGKLIEEEIERIKAKRTME